ncbi:MAG: hypothetical protein KIT08_03720 [Anaerolineales bacterium]|nr:MAG: hypothetical protein KIT08_03720 [Anaerolineales bacterium]
MSNQRTCIVVIAALAIFVSACAAPTQLNERTGIAELDSIIEIALSGDAAQLRSLIEFTPAYCTNAEGLGGPPKCLPDEAEGAMVEVLPFLGAEGNFIRRSDIESWNGVQIESLYAVYEVSDAAYSDENYPRGEYALVFLTDRGASITLQVTKGRIVRIDYGFMAPPVIDQNTVVRYLVEPAN